MVGYVSRHETQVKRNKDNYRKRIDNALQRVSEFDLMQASVIMPTLRPYEIESVPKKLVPYNVWRSDRTKGDCMHFFINDYMFIGLLNASDEELRELAKVRWVITPTSRNMSTWPRNNACTIACSTAWWRRGCKASA